VGHAVPSKIIWTPDAAHGSAKVFLGQHNRGEDYHLAHYMFAARHKAQGVPPFLQFLHLVGNDWSMCDVPGSSA
jgi:hypothetical protein